MLDPLARSRSPSAPATGPEDGLSQPIYDRQSVLSWLCPALATLLVTSYGATSAPLWRDEMATWNAVSRSVPDLLNMVRNIDAVSAPYYLFLHFWIFVFGDSTLAMRAPSILCMTAAAALTAMIGQRLFGPRAGLLGGLLFAVVPSTSRYAQEARSYAFATLFAVLATFLLIRAVAEPTWRRWAAYSAALTGLGLAHLAAVLVTVGHLCAVALAWLRDRRRRPALYWLAAVAAAGLALLPFAGLGRTQQNAQLGWVPTPGIGNLLTVPGPVFRSGALAGLTIGLAGLGWATRGRWGTVLGLSAVLPAMILFAIGQTSPVWVPRYLTFTVPLVCVLAGAALTAAPLRGALVILATCLLIGAMDQRAFRRSHEARPLDYAGAAAIIRDHQRYGDGIVYAPRDGWRFLDAAMEYHLGRNRPRDVLLKQSRVERASLWASECDRPADCLAGVHRVWALALAPPADPLVRMDKPKADALRDSFAVTRIWAVPGLTVALLVRP